MGLLGCSPIISQGIICISVYILSVFQRCLGQCGYCYPKDCVFLVGKILMMELLTQVIECLCYQYILTLHSNYFECYSVSGLTENN